MPFPISISGTIVVPKASGDLATMNQAAVRIQDMLDTALAGNISRKGNSISFTAGFGRWVGGWNILVSIDRGTIELADAGPDIRVSYTLRTVQLLMIVGMLVCVAAFVPMFVIRTNPALPSAPPWQFILIWAFSSVPITLRWQFDFPVGLIVDCGAVDRSPRRVPSERISRYRNPARFRLAGAQSV